MPRSNSHQVCTQHQPTTAHSIHTWLEDIPASPTLLGLPKELRDQVFGYIVGAPVVIDIRIDRKQVFGPPLAHVCQQIRADCLLEWYKTHTFQLKSRSSQESLDLAILFNWLHLIGPDACAKIRRLNIVVQTDEVHTRSSFFGRRIKSPAQLAFIACHSRTRTLQPSALQVFSCEKHLDGGHYYWRLDKHRRDTEDAGQWHTLGRSFLNDAKSKKQFWEDTRALCYLDGNVETCKISQIKARLEEIRLREARSEQARLEQARLKEARLERATLEQTGRKPSLTGHHKHQQQPGNKAGNNSKEEALTLADVLALAILLATLLATLLAICWACYKCLCWMLVPVTAV